MPDVSLALSCTRSAPSTARIAPAAGWGFCIVVLIACMGQSCGQSVLPPDQPPDQVLGNKPEDPSTLDDETPYDENEFPAESPSDLMEARTLTITASNWSGKPPLAVAFFASTIEGGITPTGLVWDFGDGTTYTGMRTQHTYESEGIYKVQLCPGPTTPSASVVTCGQGFVHVTTGTTDTSGTSPTEPTPATLSIVASRWTGSAPFLIAFTASTVEGVIAPAGLVWDFGDGTSETGNRVEHTFNTPGSYTVRLCPGPTTPSPELIICGQGVAHILATGVETPPIDTPCLPEITAPPAARTVDSGASGVFSVTAGTPDTVNYQWYREGQPLVDGGNMTGAASPTLVVNPARTSDAGTYSVSVSNDCGAVFSDEADLTVRLPDWATSAIRIVVPYRTSDTTTYTFKRVTRYLTDDNTDATTAAFHNYTWRAGDVFMMTVVQNLGGASLNPRLLGAYRIKRKVDSRTVEFESALRSQQPTLTELYGDAYHIRGKLQREWTADLLLAFLSESLTYHGTIDIGTTCISGGTNIHLGESQCGQAPVDLTSPPVDVEGYVLKGLDDTNYVIAGASEEGTQNGAYEFLERFLGVRWVMPDSTFTQQELNQLAPAWRPRDASNQVIQTVRGDYVPWHTANLRIPLDEIRESPAFLTRYGSGYGYSSNAASSVHAKWTRKMRANQRVVSGHNICNLYPPSLYAASNPEFYPCSGGSCGASAAGRYIPLNDNQVNWAPNFSAAELADAGADRLRAYFTNNPEVTSFSISLQDENSYMDMSAASFAREPVADGCAMNQTTNGCGTQVALNSGQVRDVSWSFFTWANDLITQIRSGTNAYDDKYVGALAYHQTFDPPDYYTRSGGLPFSAARKLDAHVIPFIAFEHLRLVDDRPAVGQRAWYESVVSRWKAITAGDLGTHDYIYSDLCPILPLSLYPTVLQSDRSAGIRHNGSEHYPNWSEAFKFYAYFKLLWNPEAKMLDDANGPGMLSDWCRAAVGPAAAPYLEQFYADWDNFWSGRNSDGGAKRLKYIQNSNRSFATYFTPDPLDDVTVMFLMKQSPILLDSCLAAALADGSSTVDQRNRARLLRAQYEYWNLTGQVHRPADDAYTAALPAELPETIANLTDGLAAQGGRITWAQTWFTDNTHGNDHIMSPGLGGAAGEAWHTPLFFRLIPFASYNVGGQTVYNTILNMDPAQYPYMELELTRSRLAFLAGSTSNPLAAYGFEQSSYTQHASPPQSPWEQGSFGDNPICPFTKSSDPQNASNPVVKIKRPPSAVYRLDRPPVLYAPYTQTTGAGAVGNYLVTVRVYLDSERFNPPDLRLELMARDSNNGLIGNEFTVSTAKIYGVRGQWVTAGALLQVPWPQCGIITLSLWVDYLSDPGGNAVFYLDDCRVYKTDTPLQIASPVVAGVSSTVSVTGLAQNSQRVKLYVNGLKRTDVPTIAGGAATFTGIWLNPGDIVSAIQEAETAAATRLVSNAVVATP